MKRAFIIRHHPVETLGSNFTAILASEGFHLEALEVFALAPEYGPFAAYPVADLDLVVALGGPLSANDDYPALAQEMALLREAHHRGVPVFAVCLGAQLLARALGGTVAPTGGYQFGLRRISVTRAGDADPVFGQIHTPLVPTLHGECFSVPPGGTALAEGYMLRRDGGYVKINMAYRIGNCYAFQFEPQLTLAELQVWNRELSGDYLSMGDRFNPEEEAARNLREFTKFAPTHEAQMADLFRAFLAHTGLRLGPASASCPAADGAREG